MSLVVQTVLGPIQPNLLGRTLTHEHFAINLEQFLVAAPDEIKPFLHKNISLDNLWLIRQYPYSCPYNVKFDDEEAREAIKKDLKLFKKFGGSSIVENTCHGLTRDLEFMTEVSKSTGVHVIAGTGHYTHNLQTPETLKLGVEQMTDLYAKEIIAGVEVNNGKNTVKCGFIGEVGCGYPLHDFEKHSILATGEIQEVLGCGVSFHPGFVPEAPFEIVRIYLEAGGKANKCVMSHLDITISRMDQLMEFAELGTFIQYDLFGVECSYFQFNPNIDMPSDGQRINNLMELISEGLVDRIMMSHDIHSKHRLTTFGGHGYNHIYSNVLPRMHGKGLTVEQVETITETNPTKWLQMKI